MPWCSQRRCWTSATPSPENYRRWEILGDQAWKLAGPFTGTYIGGSLNFFAIWTGLEIGNPDLLAAANAVDNLTLFPLFAVWIFVPDLLGPRYPVGKVWKSRTPPAVKQEIEKKTPAFRILDVAALALLALAVIEGSDLIKERFIAEQFPRFPTILLVTTFALILAQLRFVGKLEGAFEMGNLSFYLFFCTVGAMINLEKAVALCPILFLYVMIIMAVHMVVVYGVGRLLRLDIKILTMASAATKSGPASVIALANVKGWKELLLPGMAMGLLGYALGNYLGFGAAYLMKVLLGG